MTVDGVAVAASWNPVTKTLSYTPSSPLRNDATHSVALSVTDAAGASSSIAWGFGVQIYPDMVANTQCVDCHPTYPAAHPMTNCDACHGYDGPIGGFYGPPDFHPEGEAAQFLSDCTYCHGSNIYPTVPNHSDLGVAHSSTMDMTGCACHVHSLTIEHNRWTDPDGTPLDCASCHGADVPQNIKDALAAGSTNCLDCHTLSGGHPYAADTHTSQFTSSGWDGPGSGTVLLFNTHEFVGPSSYAVHCIDCHNSELGPTHAMICSTCHPVPRDSFTAWDKNCSQAACHPTYHENSAAIHEAAAGGNCTMCHVSDADQDLLPDPCGSCHEHFSPDDTTAPFTTSDAVTAYNGAANIEFSVTDGGKIGICTTFFKVDGDANVQHGDSAVVTTPGSHSLEFWSVDQNGNAETPHHTVNFTTTSDGVAPVTTSDARSVYEATNAYPATIKLTATDASTSGVKATHYTLNGVAHTGTTISIAPPASGTDSYTLVFWSEDFSGNAENPQTVTFTVTKDVAPPATTCDAVEGTTYTVAKKFTLTPTDGNGTGVARSWYKLDTGAWTFYTTAGINVPLPASGSVPHTILWYSEDKAGNIETQKSVSFTMGAPVGWTVPVITAQADRSFDWDAGEDPPYLTLSWTAVTAPDGDPCTYQIEMITQSPYSSPFSNWNAATRINTAGPSYGAAFWGGNYYYRVRAIDSVHPGSVSPASAPDVFQVFDGLYPYNSPWPGPYPQ